jgi:hypothetical protein
MARRPGHVDVTTEVAYCSFCNRTRNLRREAHHMGGLVRTIVTCETCHRTLSSTMGVAEQEEAAERVAAPEATAAPPPAPTLAEEPEPAPRKAAAKPAAAKSTTAKSTARATARRTTKSK